MNQKSSGVSEEIGEATYYYKIIIVQVYASLFMVRLIVTGLNLYRSKLAVAIIVEQKQKQNTTKEEMFI